MFNEHTRTTLVARMAVGVSESRPIVRALLESRTVLVIGKTGVGKSTVANAFLGFDKFKVANDLDSVTTECKLRKSEQKYADTKYIVNVMDTVGLFDTRNSERRESMQKMKSFVQNCTVEGVSLVVFVIKKDRFTAEDIETFDFLTKHLCAKTSCISALVITHMDFDGDDARKRFIERLRTNERFKHIVDFMQKGIYAVGLPMSSYIEDRREVLPEYVREQKKMDEETLRKLLLECEEIKLLEEVFSHSFWARFNL